MAVTATAGQERG